MNASSVNLEDLLYQCTLHDTQALSRLYQLTSPKLFALILRMVNRQDIAEELLQDAFINIWNRADSYRSDKGKALTWMMGIVRNKTIDWIRRNPINRHVSDDLLAELPDLSQIPESVLQQDNDIQALLDCMDDLSEQQRQAITQVYYQGFTHDEYANTTQQPLGTIKSWIRRGLQALKRCLE